MLTFFRIFGALIKPNYMKRLLPLLFLAFIFTTSTQVNAQNPTEWETYFENDTLKIEYKYQNCEYTEQFNNEFVIFRISNLTDNPLTVEWNEQLWYDENCINCEQVSDEFRTNLLLKAKEILQGDCNPNDSLRIFKKFTEKLEDMPGVNKITDLTKFELTNLKIK